MNFFLLSLYVSGRMIEVKRASVCCGESNMVLYGEKQVK